MGLAFSKLSHEKPWYCTGINGRNFKFHSKLHIVSLGMLWLQFNRRDQTLDHRPSQNTRISQQGCTKTCEANTVIAVEKYTLIFEHQWHVPLPFVRVITSNWLLISVNSSSRRSIPLSTAFAGVSVPSVWTWTASWKVSQGWLYQCLGLARKESTAKRWFQALYG